MLNKLYYVSLLYDNQSLKPNVMVTKEKEIKMLEELVKADGYFAEYFKKDLDQMAGNIKNDFPIENGTLFSMDGENQREINEALKSMHKTEVRTIFTNALTAVSTGDYDRIEAEAVKNLGRDEVIKLKRKNGIDLRESDIEYLISKLG